MLLGDGGRRILAFNRYANAKTRKERESGMAAQKGDLKMSDFIPCIKQPWLESCTYERHERALNTVGLVPPTMRPAYEQLRKEQEKKARVEHEASERAISDRYESLLYAYCKNSFKSLFLFEVSLTDCY